MLSEAELAQRRAIARSGGLARAKQFTHEFQQTSGRLGNAAGLARYGPHVNTRRLAFWRKTAPTRLIKIVTGWLDSRWLTFTTEAELVPGQVYADIILHYRGRAIVIECDGEHWHENNDHHGEDRQARDAKRDAQIRALGYALIHLPGRAILDGSAEADLVAFIEALQ